MSSSSSLKEKQELYVMQISLSTKNPGLARLFGQGNQDGRLTLAAIRARASRQLAKFSKLVEQQLAELSISIPPAIGLVSCPNRELTIENDHPQAEAIRAWLTGNVRIAKRFKEVEVLFEIVRAAEQPGVTLPSTACFHIGLTSAGPVAYFQDQRGEEPAR
ncbi:hypothetical protein QU481_08615 [Crenobacter sp. SG2303]|uniref:Uncharacterized protein n=1 Tax=Crenobacter oryzisoli TaxID=3056844 RepID=A0ABT7XME5_9NEIS|nr:hypothetical protein [Crenobacter sp. SG2303]MDN0074956.1 hypothetical protein [Crenobacter sp. SG2303]